MKSKGKKFLSAVLVSSMVLTSSLGFMPRTAEAVSNSSVYSYDFEYINTVTETGNRKLVLTFEKDLEKVDSTKITMLGDTTASIGMVDPDYSANTVEIVVDGIDPSELDYTLQIAAGAFEFANYQQLEPITLNFKSYDITPGFKSIFKDSEEANKLFDRNDPSEIILHVDSDYVTDITAKNIADADMTEIGVATTDEVANVTIEVMGITGDNTRTVETKTDDKFVGVFSGVTGIHTIYVEAFDAAGKLLDTQAAKNDFGTEHGTNFNTDAVGTFDPAGYAVSDILSGAVDINDVVVGKSYSELDEIGVQYAKADNIFTVNSGAELADALAQVKALTGKTATIKLGSDITLTSGIEAIFQNDENRLTIKGDGNTITGDIQLGNDDDQTVRLVDVNVVGNVEVNVGSAGDAYLTDVNISGGDLIVTSGAYSSVYLTRVTVDKMTVKNEEAVHIVAMDGTLVGQVEIVDPDGDSTSVPTNGDVKLTIDGGSFGSNIANKMDEGKLVLEGQSFEKLTIDSLADAPVVQLLKNTTILELVASQEVTMTGTSSSKVVKSSDSTGKINYDGFVIEDATSDTNKYAGTNVPDSSGNVADEITIPTSNDNLLTVTGNMVDGITISEVDAGNGYINLVLDGNINWKDGVTSATLFGLTGFMQDDQAGTFVDVAVADYSVTKVNAKTLRLDFDGIAGETAAKVTIKLDPSKLDETVIEPDASILGTDEWGSNEDTQLEYQPALYRPSLQGTGEILVYAEQDLTGIDLIVDRDPGTGVVVKGVSTNYEYRTNLGVWTAFTADGQDIASEFTGMTSGETRMLQIRVADGDSEVQEFEIKSDEPWFMSVGLVAADLKAALIDPDVYKIHLADDGDYDLSGEAALTASEREDFESKGETILRFEGSTVRDVKLPGNTDENLVTITASASTLTASPIIRSVVGTIDPDGDDTIEITFNEAVTAAGTATNWTIDLDDDNTGNDGAEITGITDGELSYDGDTKKLTITLDKSSGRFLTPGKYLDVIAANANIVDADGNQLLASGSVYSGEITAADTTAPTMISATYLDSDNNGTVDKVALKFSEDIAVATATGAELTWIANDITSSDLTAAAGTISGDTVTYTFDTPGAADTTGGANEPTIAFTAAAGKTFADKSGNVVEDFVAVDAVDGADPLVAALNTSTSVTGFVFTEPVYLSGTAITNSADVSALISETSVAQVVSTAVYTTADDTITVTLDGAAANTEQVLLDASNLTDKEGNDIADQSVTTDGSNWTLD